MKISKCIANRLANHAVEMHQLDLLQIVVADVESDYCGCMFRLWYPTEEDPTTYEAKPVKMSLIECAAKLVEYVTEHGACDLQRCPIIAQGEPVHTHGKLRFKVVSPD